MPLAIPYPEPALTASGLVLRPFCAADAESAATVANGSVEMTFVEALPELDGASLERTVEAHRLDGTMLQLVVADPTDDRYLGEVTLVVVDPGVAELGCAVLPSERGRGLAGTAFRLVSDWALGTLSLRRLQAMVEPGNHAALRLAEAAGYAREGLLRSYWELDGRRLDAVLLARVREDMDRGRDSPGSDDDLR